MTFDGLTALSGLLVGVMVGITGVGGGSLMTPILVLLFGVAPQTAVGTDLLLAALTKTVGTAVHQKHGTVDWEVVKRLAMGSLPAAALTLAWMAWTKGQRVTDGFVMHGLAVALIITAIGMVFKDKLHLVGRRQRIQDVESFRSLQRWLTVLCGAVLGVLVTLTSVGAGALGTVMLVYLYPLRLTPARLVGTDLAHAIPLTLLAGFGHFLVGNVDFGLLGTLLVGTVPGVLIGSVISTRAPMKLIQTLIAVVLTAVAVKMLFA